MSADTVRTQLKAFLSSPAITGIGKVYRSEPWFIAGEKWSLVDNGGWGSVVWPWISDEKEDRLTLGASTPGGPAAGQKAITYTVSIVVLYEYLIPASLPSGQEEDAWQAPLDTIIEGIKARLRSDPKAGTGDGLDGVIFEQSQEPGDLAVMRDTPVLAKGGGKVIVWQRIDTTVKEIITA